MSRRTKFLYETNVGAGLPVIDTLQALIRSGDELKSFDGILSGSLSMIFGMLEDGMPISAAVGKAVELGYTEPDPRDDLSGMDVARKLLIVAREVGLELELSDVEVEPAVPMAAIAQVDKAHLIEALKSLDRCEVGILLLDATEGVAEQDAKIARFIYEKGKGCIIAVNKWDLMPQDQAQLREYLARRRPVST